jgi:hypothetical protein
VTVAGLGAQADDDIAWAATCQPPKDEEKFALEVIFVICNSGMKNTVARGIFERVRNAIFMGDSASSVFGHKGKAAAIDLIWRHQATLFFDYCMACDKLAFLESLPWIGRITKYHLAKNFGMQVAKPDVHLQRIADREGCTAQEMCERLARESGLSVIAVDTLLWRACANGLMNSRTGEVRA